MRLSELLRAEVRDESGAPLGRVHDVRLVQAGPLLSGFDATLRVDGLIVGPGSAATRLGYDRAGVDGPWLFKVLFERLRGRSKYVPWHRVVSITEDGIAISGSRDDLDRPTPLTELP